MTEPANLAAPRPTLLQRLRNYLVTGLLVLAPTTITIWIVYRLVNWSDYLLGRYLRFEVFDYHRIPGAGLFATILLLLIVGFLARLLGQGPLALFWDRLLLRIPGVGIVYGSTKSLGEAFLNQKEQAFRKVVLVPWPYPGIYRIGFVTGRVTPALKARMSQDLEVVFIPHTPNPASGFVHYVPRDQITYLDWTIEEGIKVVVSGGVVQPEYAADPQGQK